ncbi:MAG TPA: UvrD-helicase domain-containing protein [Chitinophagales bacterium]|nr:UvrD-helicase domain-containing protein [Chitinophagales bacterium]
MKLTKEQQAIIGSTGNITINAVAGSGKTTTVIEYARTRPAGSKILYVAFNKAVKLEAAHKFAEKGLSNVKVETAHSLAYKHVVFKYDYKVRQQAYKTNEIVELLGLQGTGEKHTEYIVANHINKFMAYFCNSDKAKVQDLNYRDIVTDTKARAFVNMCYDYIQKHTRLLLAKMDKGEIEITHDFYLKKFQLASPQLNYDYILFDEGQDASPAMLDIFMKQNAVKVIVGDTHQQIYGWRFAVNSLEKTGFKQLNLSTSFRFAQPIADLGMEILKWKDMLGPYTPTAITGAANTKAHKSKAILARTNLGLLLKAIEYVTEKKVKYIYFEGNINSYTYASEGASLYDVLNLHNGNKYLIKDTLIKSMRDIPELEDYIEMTEEAELGMMVEIVKEYGNRIPGILKEIKEKHVGNDEKEKADMVFSTVHRCKGMEYDVVQLVNDFITFKKLEQAVNSNQKADAGRLSEEINLLYVAVTRAKSSLHIPETLMPVDFPPSANIHVLKVVEEEEEDYSTVVAEPRAVYNKKAKPKPAKEKAYSVENARENNKDAYKPWTERMDAQLTVMYYEGVNIKDMAKHFGRTRGSIAMRIKKLELEELYG